MSPGWEGEWHQRLALEAPLLKLPPYPRKQGLWGRRQDKHDQQTEQKRVNSKQCLYLPFVWDTQPGSWGPARLAYCLALFTFGAMGALSGREREAGVRVGSRAQHQTRKPDLAAKARVDEAPGQGQLKLACPDGCVMPGTRSRFYKNPSEPASFPCQASQSPDDFRGSLSSHPCTHSLTPSKEIKENKWCPEGAQGPASRASRAGLHLCYMGLALQSPSFPKP